MVVYIYGLTYIIHMNIQSDSFFKLLADTTRLRCLLLMQAEGELCVCELTHALGLSQPKVSRHLASLREAGIVLDRREGLWIYYRLHPELPAWAQSVIEATLEGVSKHEPFIGDHVMLTEMPNRPSAVCCA